PRTPAPTSPVPRPCRRAAPRRCCPPATGIRWTCAPSATPSPPGTARVTRAAAARCSGASSSTPSPGQIPGGSRSTPPTPSPPPGRSIPACRPSGTSLPTWCTSSTPVTSPWTSASAPPSGTPPPRCPAAPPPTDASTSTTPPARGPPSPSGPHPDVKDGSTFTRAIEPPPAGPRPRTTLTSSESPTPASPHYTDQTRLFSHKQWVTERFTQAQITSDPQL